MNEENKKTIMEEIKENKTEGKKDLEEKVLQQAKTKKKEKGEEKGTIWTSLKDALLSPSVDTPLDEYITHPLNVFESKSFGQILRGLEGFFGSLKLAIIDIFVGAIKFIWEQKEGKEE